MKTPEEILESNCPVFSALFHDKTNKASVMMRDSILKSMDEYARSKWDEAVEADRQIMIASMPVGTELKAWDFVIWAKNHFESNKPEF